MSTAEGSSASCHGPITQAHFLEALGIRERLEGLLQTASQEEGEQLISGYYRLVSSSSDDADSQREVNSLLSAAASYIRKARCGLWTALAVSLASSGAVCITRSQPYAAARD